MSSSFHMTYKEFFTRFYHNNTGYLNSLNRKIKNSTVSFHTSCPYTKRKKCFCKFQRVSPTETSINLFAQKLYNGQYDIDITGKDIKIVDLSLTAPSLVNDQLINEHIKETNYEGMKDFTKHVNEMYLSIKEYKDVEKLINDDRKVCKTCGCLLDGDNYHNKGRENENGESMTLCYNCHKRYYDGASTLKYEREEYSMTQGFNMTQRHGMHGSSGTLINPFRTDEPFRVINTAKKEEEK